MDVFRPSWRDVRAVCSCILQNVQCLSHAFSHNDALSVNNLNTGGLSDQVSDTKVGSRSYSDDYADLFIFLGNTMQCRYALVFCLLSFMLSLFVLQAGGSGEIDYGRHQDLLTQKIERRIFERERYTRARQSGRTAPQELGGQVALARRT